jgi:hypothetical protein
VYAARDEFFAGARLADNEDAQVEARGDHDIFPDLADQFRFADEFVKYHRASFNFRLSLIGAPISSGQDLDPARGQMGGDFNIPAKGFSTHSESSSLGGEEFGIAESSMRFFFCYRACRST